MASESAKLVFEPLTASHGVSKFTCGKQPLDDYLRKHALANQNASAARTYVAIMDGMVIGFYTLTAAQVERESAPQRVGKGLAKYPVPVILLARLAVHSDWQRKGVGPALLKNALLRAMQAADLVGARAVEVHAKDDEARSFYEHFDFLPSPVDQLHLFLLMKDIKAMTAANDSCGSKVPGQAAKR